MLPCATSAVVVRPFLRPAIATAGIAEATAAAGESTAAGDMSGPLLKPYPALLVSIGGPVPKEVGPAFAPMLPLLDSCQAPQRVCTQEGATERGAPGVSMRPHAAPPTAGVGFASWSAGKFALVSARASSSGATSTTL